MKPPPFAYHAPPRLDIALELLTQHGTDAKVLAGGQSLVPLMNLRLARPAVIVDLNPIAELAYVHADAATLVIGAMTRQRTLERDTTIAAVLPPLRATAARVGHLQTRNRGTLGGSLAHADPAAELPALALALEARLTLAGPAGRTRTLTAEAFFQGMLTTALEPEEILTEVAFPRLPPQTGWSVLEVTRRHADFALVGVVATLTLDARGNCAAARLVLFGVGDTPVRVRSIEAALVGQPPDQATIRAAAAAVTQEINPGTDQHASTAYRSEVAVVLVERALTEAAVRAMPDMH